MVFLKEAEDKWNKFLDSKISKYSSLRNYDYGPYKNSYVSKLSPFISHRFLLEYDLIRDIKNKHHSNNVNKFIEEVYWRIYWKGWLENKPCVWDNFISKNIDKFDSSLYEEAINGKTKLSYFNEWLEELKNFNYLHNHTRMWFASTWIFNLGLPWELGAKLFFEHLYDGDAASNLLSWRWVAGLQTKGKQYLFSPENLKKYSNNRFVVNNIYNRDINLKDDFEIVINKEIFNNQFKKKSQYLLLFENDLNQKSLKTIIDQYKKAYLIILNDKDRQLKISQRVYEFKEKLINEFAANFKNIEVIDSLTLTSKIKNIEQLDLIYPSIGDNNDFINRFKSSNNKVIKYLVREEDLFAWQFADKGFFKFKKDIPLINNFLFQKKRLW
tara:strand:+ start:306 stop:1454 length:1149 start_codon:yes stop_codon:yes gene_type:complete